MPGQSFAFRALALGESLPMIGKLLGHSQIETTARYAHLARDSVKEAAERVAATLDPTARGASAHAGRVSNAEGIKCPLQGARSRF